MPYSDIEALDALEAAEAKVAALTDQLTEASKVRDKARLATAPFAVGDEVELRTDAGWVPAKVTFIRLAYASKHGPEWFFDYDVEIGPSRDTFNAVAEWDAAGFRNRIRSKRRKIVESSA